MISRVLRSIGILVTLAAFGAAGQCGGQNPDDLFGLDTALIAPAVMGGTVEAHDFTVPAGQTTSVVSDLIVNATGDVRIEGQLVADPATVAGTKGASITIIAQGNIEVTGTVQAANGTDGTASAASMAIAQAGQVGSVSSGADGGTVELRAGGNLTIGDAARITSGSGGHGEEGKAGGAGGQGGDMAFIAGGALTLRGIHYVGNGGNGGLATPAAPTPDEPPPAEWVFSATGGDSGALYVSGVTIDWPGYNAEDGSFDDTFAAASAGPGFGGGEGGRGGDVVIEDAQQTTVAVATDGSRQLAAADPYTFCAADACHYSARNGGDGWFRGGDGGTITVRVHYLPATAWDAPKIGAQGGNGGNVVRSAHRMYGLPTTRTTAGGGDGGGANVYAGDGRVADSSHLDGGFGGTAIAYGGKGGNGASYKGSRGGAGGYGYAVAGAGGHGYVPPQPDSMFAPPVCSPVGAGGAGGIANAYGGRGGDAYFAGLWGGAIAIGGGGGAAVNSPGAAGTAVAELPEVAVGIEDFFAEPGAAAQGGAAGLVVELGCGGQ